MKYHECLVVNDLWFWSRVELWVSNLVLVAQAYHVRLDLMVGGILGFNQV